MCGRRSGRSVRRYSPPSDGGHLPRQGVPRHGVVLLERRQLQARREHRRDDLADAVIPLVRDVLREHLVGLDVGAVLVPDHRLGLLEVRVLDGEDAIGPRVAERPEHGMALADEEPPARPQETRDDLGPACDVGQPAERADAREDEVEALAAERLGRAVEIGVDELDLCADRLGEPLRLRERGRREVESGHARAEPGERHRVGADVTLQMDAVEPGDVAEPGEIERHDLAQERRVVAEARDGVVGRGGVRSGALVPARPVDRTVVVHVRSVAHAAARGRRLRGAVAAAPRRHEEPGDRTSWLPPNPHPVPAAGGAGGRHRARPPSIGT